MDKEKVNQVTFALRAMFAENEIPEDFHFVGQTFIQRCESWALHAVEQLEDELKAEGPHSLDAEEGEGNHSGGADNVDHECEENWRHEGYVARDREWQEENEPPEELDEDGITDTLRFDDFSFEQRPLSELPTGEELGNDFSGDDQWVDGDGEGGGLVYGNHIIVWQDEPLTDSDMLEIVEEQLERREEDRLDEEEDQITEELDRVNWIDGGF